MAHLGLVCPEISGHLNPMITLGRALRRRGHRVSLLGSLDAEQKAAAAGFEFSVLGASDFPSGWVKQLSAELGKLRGLAAVRYTIDHFADYSAILLKDGRRAIHASGVEGLVTDQVSTAIGTVAESLGMPFVTVCSALLLNQDANMPPAVTSWRHSDAPWARCRNRLGYFAMSLLTRRIMKIINSARRELGLTVASDVDRYYSPLAQVSQQPAEFEFPRRNLPSCFHFTGPFHDLTDRPLVPFPFEKLTGQPLVYASMGTLQNRRGKVFQTIVSACRGLDIQLVVSRGGSDVGIDSDGSSQTLIVDFAPQLELLERASLAITHAGLNTALESLACGVPMVAIPITNDQPGVAARIAWTGAGVVVPLLRLTVPRLREAVQQVLSENRFRENAVRLRTAIQEAHGPDRAAEIIDRAITTRKPVLRV